MIEQDLHNSLRRWEIAQFALLINDFFGLDDGLKDLACVLISLL